MVQMEGTYEFVSQDNFENYLKAAGVGMLTRKVILKTSPTMKIEINGKDVTTTTITSIKTIVIKFTLGEEYEADPGTGMPAKYVSTVEGDVLYSREVANPDSLATRTFTDDGMEYKTVTKGVTATRYFKRKTA